MRSRVLSLVAGVAVLVVTAGGALAGSSSLDLSNPQNGSGFTGDSGYFAQTFTADKTGLLIEVDLWMGYGNGAGSHSVTVYIQTVDSSGAPVGAPPPASPLTSAAGLVPSDPAWVPFVFPTPIGIASGTTYAIVFVTTRANVVYFAGPYAGGKTWSYDSSWAAHDWQFAFQDWLILSATAAPPTIGMVFGAASIPVGGTASLIFTITNPNTVPTLDVRPGLALGTLTNIGFTDTLPAGLLIATPNNLGGSCGGAITATAGTNLVSLTGLTLATGASCGFGINVVGVAPGAQANTTSAITSTQSDPGLAATASITVTALATPTPAPTATPSQSVLAVTAAPVRTSTPPPTSTGDSRGSGGESPLLPLLALAAVAALTATTFVLRSESRVNRR
ncbi:MAG: DUF7933 domain-containing protein [Candidatus Limnocylindrales bacterium]